MKKLDDIENNVEKPEEPASAPVEKKPVVKENIRKLTWSNAWLEKDIPKTAASAMSLNKNCSQVRIIVSHIDFDDRGVWSNPQALDWILSQE